MRPLDSTGQLTPPEFELPCRYETGRYLEYLFHFNHDLQSKVREYLRKLDLVDEDDPGILLCATGSDGRNEKGPMSRMEILIILKDISSKCRCIISESNGENLDRHSKQDITCEHHLQRIVCELKRKFERLLSQSDVFDGIEVKRLDDSKTKIIHFMGDSNRVWPSRILDARALLGNGRLLSASRTRIFSELTDARGPNEMEKIRQIGKIYRKISRNKGQATFRGSSITHFDLDEGVLYYNPQRGQYSLKYGPVRAVQLTLIHDLLRLLIQHPEGREKLKVFPENTAARLMLLKLENFTNLTDDQSHDLIELYEYFLWHMHLSQNRFLKDNITEVEIDKRQMSENLRDLMKILDQGILKKTL